MPRSLVLGNGQILVCFDSFGQIRDFYFPYAGLENQMYKGCIGKIGVWVDNQFSWFDSGAWSIVISYQEESLVSNIVATNTNLGVEITFTDVVYNEKNVLVRQVQVKNKSSTARVIKVFLSNQFHLLANKTGNTAYFDPNDKTIVHYKGRRIVVVGGLLNGKPFSDYSIGVFGIEGKVGTWLDAEDGILSKNPVEHGPVDSVVCFEDHVETNSEFTFHFWYTVAKSLADAKDLHSYVLQNGPSHIIGSTRDYWKAWVNKRRQSYKNLDNSALSLFKKSLLIMKTHVDNNGSIIASADSDMLQFGKDTYSYVWTRDASFASKAMDSAGYSEISRKFFEFCNEVISPEGFFYHKYQPDKSLGSSWHPWLLRGEPSLPIQEDETALVIYALWNHFECTQDIEFIESIYNSLVKKAANFMVKFRYKETGLPKSSYDLWEMKNGTSTFTSCSVYASLMAAHRIAKILGKRQDSEDYHHAALEIAEGIKTNLWDEKGAFFYKSILPTNDEILHDTTVDASSFYGVFKFGVLDPDDPKLDLAYDTLKSHLIGESASFGVARFDADTYYQKQALTQGNPWFVTTLWVTQYQILKAKSLSDLEKAYRSIEWVCNMALPSGVLSEQLDPSTGEQVSASPLVWSHAEFVVTVLEYLEKLQNLKHYAK